MTTSAQTHPLSDQPPGRSADPGTGSPLPALASPVPPLPASAHLDPSLAAGCAGWLELYLAYAGAVCPAVPAAFHESAALWLAALVIARRLRAALPDRHVYPNLFIAWLAPSYPWDAAAALALVRCLAEDSFPALLLPTHLPVADLPFLLGGRMVPATPRDGGFDHPADLFIAQDFVAQRGWLLDDLCRLLGSPRASLRAELAALLTFHDCPPCYRHASRRDGLLVVSRPYLSLLGLAAPQALAPHLSSPVLWDIGGWPRFALLVPPSDPPAWQPPQFVDRPPELLGRLAALHAAFPGPVPFRGRVPLDVAYGPGVADALLCYQRAVACDLITPDLDPRLAAGYAWLPLHFLKVSLILAALDWAPPLPAAATPKNGRPLLTYQPPHQPANPPNPPTIGLSHLARAQSIVETWRAGLHAALAQADAPAARSLESRVLRQLARSGPAGATARTVRMNLRDVHPALVDRALSGLCDLGLATRIPVSSPPQGGRPTFRYRLAAG